MLLPHPLLPPHPTPGPRKTWPLVQIIIFLSLSPFSVPDASVSPRVLLLPNLDALSSAALRSSQRLEGRQALREPCRAECWQVRRTRTTALEGHLLLRFRYRGRKSSHRKVCPMISSTRLPRDQRTLGALSIHSNGNCSKLRTLSLLEISPQIHKTAHTSSPSKYLDPNCVSDHIRTNTSCV